MKCVICKHGETSPGRVTVPLVREGKVLVVKDVPAEICGNCGEYYLTEEVTAKLLARAEKSAAKGAEVEVIQFAA